MSNPTTYSDQQLEEIAAICFRKIASIEARFVILCQRAEAAGIECGDLLTESFPGTSTPILRITN